VREDGGPLFSDFSALAGRPLAIRGTLVGQGARRFLAANVDAADNDVFWESLAGYATEGSDDPRAVLLFTIRQMRELGQLRRPGESIGLVFSAWNAWRDKQKVRTLTTRDHKGRPLRIPQPV